MDGNKFLIEVGVDTSPAEKDLAAFMNKLNSMRDQAASKDSKSSSAQLPPEAAAAAFNDTPIDLSKQTSDLKEQAKIQRQIVQDRGKLVGLLQEEARIAQTSGTGGRINSGELQNIRKGAEDALATAFGSGKLSASLKGVLTKAINETVASVRAPDGKVTTAQALTAKTNPAPPERFVSRSTAVLKTVGINASAAIRPNVDILKDFNKAVSSSQGDVLAILSSIGTSFGKVVEGAEVLAGNFAGAAKDQGKALDDMTSSMEETAKNVGKVNNEILKNLSDRAKKAAIDTQKTYGARQKEVIKTVVDNPGITYDELKATGAPAQTIQSLTNRGLKKVGDGYDVDVSALTNFDAELTKVLSEFVGPVAGSITQIQELQDAVKRLVSGVDTVAVEAESTAKAVAQDGLFGEKGKSEPVRKGTVPQDEPAPEKKEKFAQTNFLAQEQTIEDALAAEATVVRETVDAKEQGLDLQKRVNEASQNWITAEEEWAAYYDALMAKYGAAIDSSSMVNDEIVSGGPGKKFSVTMQPEEVTKLNELEEIASDFGAEAAAAEDALRSFTETINELTKVSGQLKESYFNDYASARVNNNGFVTNLATREDKRGQGYGSDVMNQIISDADALGRDLVLSARDELEGFYGQFGFQKTGRELFGLPEYIRLAQSASDLADATEVAADEHVKLGEQAANLTKAQVAAIQKYSTDAGQATFNDKGSAGVFRYDMADTLKAKDFAQGIVGDPAASAVAKRAAESILKSTEFTMGALRMSAGNAEEVAKLGGDQAVVDAVILAEKERIAQRLENQAKRKEQFTAENTNWNAERDANIARGKAMEEERSKQLEAEKGITEATESYEEIQKRKWAEADAAFGRGGRATVGSPGGQANGGNPDIGGPGFTLQNDISKTIYQSPDDAWIEFNDKLAQLTLANLSDTEAELVKQLAAEQAITNSRVMEQGMADLAARLEAQRAASRQKKIDAEDSVQISNEQNAIGGQIISAMEDELKARREAAEAAAQAPLSESDKQALANAEQPTLISSTSTLDSSLTELEKELILAAERVKAIVNVPVQDLKAGDQIWRNAGAGTLERTLKKPQGKDQIVDYVPDTNYPILGMASEGDTLSVLKKVDADRLANGETALSLEEARTVIAQKLLETDAELAPVQAAFKTEQEKALILRKELNAWLQKRIDEQGLEAKAEDVNVFQDGEVYKKSGPGSRTPLFKLSKAEEQEYRNRAQRTVEPNALTFTKNGANTGYPSLPRGGDRILSTINREYETLAGLIRKQIDSTFEASVTLEQLNGLLSSTALSQEEIDKVSLIILDKQRKSLEGYLINNPNRTDTDANPDEQSVRQQVELDQTLNDINRILGLRKEAEEQVVKAVQEQAVIQENINKSKEVLVPDAVIQPDRSPAEVRGPKIPSRPQEIIDVQSASDEDKLAKRLANQEYARQKLAKSAAGTAGTEPIDAVGESAKRLSATMDESLTAVKGLSPAMLAVIDILESTELSLGEFTKSFGSRGSSLKALITRGAVTTNDQGKLTVASREEIPGLFKASSDRKLDSKRTIKSDAIEQAKAEADALIEEYGAEVVLAFGNNLAYFNEQYVDFLTTRIESLELTLGDSDNGGALGGIEIPTPLINKDLYQRFGEVVGPEWDFYVEAFLKENAAGALSFQGTKFTKADIDSLLFSQSDPQAQLNNASNDIRDRIETGQSRLPGESVATGFEDFLANTPGLAEANLSINEYVAQLLELTALSEQVRDVSIGLSDVDISTAMALFGDDLYAMADVNEQISGAIRSEREAKLQAIEENRAALKVYKEAFDYANDPDFAELSTSLQDALKADLQQAATEASAVLRSNEPILGQASTARTINVDEGKAIDNLIGMQNALENKIFDEAVANLAPLENAQQLLVNEVVDGAKIEAQTNAERLNNLGKTKAAEPVQEEVPVNGQFVDGETGLVTALARKIEALDKQSGVLENIYPSFEEAERELVYALNRKRQLLDAQSDALEAAGTTLPPLSEIDPFQAGGTNNGPKFGVNPYDTMNPGGTGGGSGNKGGLVGEGDEDGFDPVEAALARIEAAERTLLTNIALFSAVFEESGQLFADKLAELQAGIKGFNAALEGKTLIEVINQDDSFKNVTQGGAEKLAAESVIEGQTAAELLAKGNEDLLYFFVEGQKLLAESMQEISKQIYDGSLEADKKIRTAWENAETAFTILTQTNAESGEKLSELFSSYTSKLSVFNEELKVLTKEGITDNPELLGRVGEAKGKSRIADTTVANQTNQSILDTINNNPEDGGDRNLVQELVDAQIALIRSTSELAELRNQQIIDTKDVLEQLADEDTSILNLKNAREATAQALGDSLPAGAQKDFLALQRRNAQNELNVNNPAFIQQKQREADIRQRQARAISGESQAPGITGKITRYLGYQPERGGAGFKQFFGGGALAALRYGLPGQLLRGGASKIGDTIKEAEELQYNLSRLEGQFDSTFQGQDFGPVREGILSIAKETGLAADEIANFQIQITGAFADQQIGGLTGQKLIQEQVASASKLAQTVGLPLAEITDGLTAASLAFNASFEKIGDVAVKLEQESGVLARETISFIGDIAPVAEEAGYSLEEFAAIAAVAQQRSGRSGSALAESFGRVIPALTEQKDKLMELAEITPSLNNDGFIDAVRLSDPKKILEEIGKAYASMGADAKQATINLLGGRREAQALIPAIANQALVARFEKDAKNAAGSLDDRFKKVQETLTNSIARISESVRQLGVNILDAGLTDTLELAISLAERLLGVLTPIAGVFADINSGLSGTPVTLLATLAALKGFQSFAFKDVTKEITNPDGSTSEQTSRQLVGLDMLREVTGGIKDNFNKGFRESLSKPAFQTLSARYGPNIPVADAGALAASGISDASLRNLTGAGQKLKASGKGVLSAIGGGDAAVGGAFVGITALTTLYGAINAKGEQAKAEIADLNKTIEEQNSELDFDVPEIRANRVEDLRQKAIDASKDLGSWWDQLGAAYAGVSEADTYLAQAEALDTTAPERDAIKLSQASSTLRSDIFDQFSPKLGRGTDSLRDNLENLQTVRDYANKTGKEIETTLNKDTGKTDFKIDNYSNFAFFDQDQLDYINKISEIMGQSFEELDTGFLRAAAAGDSGASIADLAANDPEAVKKYGSGAIDDAQKYLAFMAELAKTNPELAREMEAFLADSDKLPPLEDNELQLEQLKAGFDTGVISLEEYSNRLIEGIRNKRLILQTGEKTAASELQLLKVLQEEQQAYAEYAATINSRNQKALERDKVFGGAGETEQQNLSLQQNLNSLKDPLFRDRDAREKAAFDIVEAQKNIALDMALQADDISATQKILNEGVAVDPMVQAILTVSDLEDTEAFTKAAEKLTKAWQKLFDRNFDVSGWYEKILADVFDDGSLTSTNQQGLDTMLNETLGQMNAASFEGLSKEDQQAIEQSFDSLIAMMNMAGYSRDKIIAALRRQNGNAGKSDEELGAQLDAILLLNPLPSAEDYAKIERTQGLQAIDDQYVSKRTSAEENSVAQALYAKQQADEELLYLQNNKGSQKEIEAALDKQNKTENALAKAYADSASSLHDLAATRLRIQGDLIGAMNEEIAALDEQIAAAAAAQNWDQVNSLMGQKEQKLDDERKQNVANANAFSQLFGGLAELRGDSVEAALFGLQEANRNVDAARTPEEKASAALAQAQAQADLIKAKFTEKARDFDLFAAYLESNGDSVNAIRTNVAKAQAALDSAIAGGNKDDINSARIELLNQQASLRKAIGDQRDGDFQLLSAIIAGEDPVKKAILEQAAAQEAFARAVGPDEIRAATIRLIEANKAVANAQNDVRIAMMGLRQAELQAVEDTVGSAQIGVAIARQQLNDLIKAGAGDAAIANGRAALITADKAAKDAVFNERQDEYKWLLDMGKISKSQYIDYLEGLKSTLIPGTKQFRDLELSIKQLKDDIGGDLQANLPTSLKLPTLYEVRRFDQTGASSGGATAGGVGYQDNRQVAINVNIDGASQDVAGQVVQAMQEFAGIQNNGYGVRRF